MLILQLEVDQTKLDVLYHFFRAVEVGVFSSSMIVTVRAKSQNAHQKINHKQEDN